jgi:exonuclease SbcD
MVVGNHDMPGTPSKAHTMDAFATLDVPNVIIGDRPGDQIVETKSGPVYVAWMPYPMRNRLLALEENQGKTIEELEAALREQVGAILRSLRPERNDIPAILAGHFTVNGATTGAEGLLALGKDVAALLEDVADPAWDYVAMGHIHKFQDVNAGRYPSVVYPGSLERVDFGEANNPKGFCWVDLERGKTSWEFIEVNARPFIVVDVDITASEAPSDTAMEAINQADIPAGAVVKVRVKMRADQQGMLREKELQDALAGTSSVTIAKDIVSEVRTRLGDLSPEALTPLELVGKFFESKGEPPERIEKLHQAAGEMMG